VGKQMSATARAFMDFARLEAKALVMHGSARQRQ